MQRTGRDLPLAAGRGIWSLHRRSGDITDACVRELRGFGVDTSRIVTGDGRFGVYYVEGGANQLPSRVIYDRAWSAIAMAMSTGIKPSRAWSGFTSRVLRLQSPNPRWRCRWICTGSQKARHYRFLRPELSQEPVEICPHKNNHRLRRWLCFTILSIRRFLPLPRSTGSGMCVSPGRSA